jgi:hypothetical protein
MGGHQSQSGGVDEEESSCPFSIPSPVTLSTMLSWLILGKVIEVIIEI